MRPGREPSRRLRSAAVKEAKIDIKAVSFYPWLLMPVAFIVIMVLSFNFLGDGLRDAADPYR